MQRNKPILYSILLFFFTCGIYSAQSLTQLPAENDVEILIILPNGYGPNYFIIRDTFETYGWNVTTAATTSSVPICHLFTNTYAGSVYVDNIVTGLNADDFDAVFLVSSEQSIPNPMGDILQSPEAISLVSQFSNSNKAVSTFCQGVKVFVEANILDGKTVTGPQTFSADCVNAGATFLPNKNAPIKDGMMVTTLRGRTNCVRFPEQIEKAIQGN